MGKKQSKVIVNNTNDKTILIQETTCDYSKTTTAMLTPKKKKIGILNPRPYMSKYIEELKSSFDIFIITCDDNETNTRQHIEELKEFCHTNELSAVLGMTRKDAWRHSLINRALGVKSISSIAYLISTNKYMQRVIEQKMPYMEDREFFIAPVTPESETNEEILAKIPANEWPIMLKNTSLSNGHGVFLCKTPEKVCKILDEYRQNEKLQCAIKHSNDTIMEWFDDDDKNILADNYGAIIPPFLLERYIDRNDGWVQYCIEGCVNDDGSLVMYGLTEELYSTDHVGLAYVTPPMSFARTNMPLLEDYVREYMDILIKQGYVKHFFNVKVWGKEHGGNNGNLEFAWCRINPHCVHSYHIPYQFAYKTSLWGDNINLVLNNSFPPLSPWDKYMIGDYSVSLQILISVMGCEGKKVHEILDYDFVDHIENQQKVNLIRHTKDRDYVITSDDADSGAGCTLMQIFVKCATHNDAAAFEVAIRERIYLLKQGDEQPNWWHNLANEGSVAEKTQFLCQGM